MTVTMSNYCDPVEVAPSSLLGLGLGVPAPVL